MSIFTDIASRGATFFGVSVIIRMGGIVATIVAFQFAEAHGAGSSSEPHLAYGAEVDSMRAGPELAPEQQAQAARAVDSSWVIEGGSYADVRVPIQTRELASQASRNSRFWRTVSGSGGQRFVGWKPSGFPIAVAFRHRLGVRIMDADSMAFWAIARRMETDLGMRLFRPASLALDEDPVDVIVVDVKRVAGSDGLTLITWAAAGDVYDARIFMKSAGTLHDPRVVTHELMHALGFAHTTGWISVMHPSGDRVERLTPQDVAHAQLAFHLRAAAERSDMWQKLASAIDREPADPERRQGDRCLYTDHPYGEAAYATESLELRSPAVCTSCPCSAS